MQEVLEFLNGSPLFYLATIDENNQPRVRPFGFVFEWEGKLTFGTDEVKQVHKQMQDNPYVEICSFKKGEWIRIHGKVKIFKNRDATRKIMEVSPSLKKILGTDEPASLVCVSIIEGEAGIYSLSVGHTNPVKTIKLM